MIHENSVVVQESEQKAIQWGIEDALTGVDQRGSLYFTIGSAEWKAYNYAYMNGVLATKEERQVVCDADADDLSGILDELRNGDTVPLCEPFADADHEEMEREQLGAYLGGAI